MGVSQRSIRAALLLIVSYGILGAGCGEPGEPGLIGARDGGPDAASGGAGGVGGPDAFVPAEDAMVVDVPDMADIPDAAPTGPEAPSMELAEAVGEFDGQVYLYGRNLATGDAVALRADQPIFAGELFRFFTVLTYARQVADGSLDAESEVDYTAEFERSPEGFLGTRRVGETFTVSDLARYTLNLGDRSAEALLLSVIGGAEAVQGTISDLALTGLGQYRTPCERDRVYAEALDARFSGVSCVALGRFLYGDDTSGIVPDPFEEAPEFDDDTLRAAIASVEESGVGLATARAWGEVLTRLYRGSLINAETNALLREMFEQSLGSGGGGDELPAPLWVSNFTTGFYAGRHWLGMAVPPEALMDDELEPLGLAMLTTDRQIGANPGALFADAGRLIHEQLVGPVDLTPPLSVTPAPDWLEGVFLAEAAEASMCNEQFSQDFDALLECRQSGERAGFVLDEETAGAVMIREGPQADVAWFWTQPDGTRHRYQQRLFAGGWWAWTRSFRAFVAGLWRLDIYINGQPYMLRTFEVTE